MGESLLSKKNQKIVKNGLWDTNPVTFQVLGICSALAVTTQVKTAIVLSIGLTVVTAFSNVVISLIRNFIPSNIRIIVQLTVVSALVITVDQILKAFAYDVSKQLSVFVGLIITNCIVMGRLEAFAMGNPPWKSFLDGLANGLGYSGVLVLIGIIREIFGAGTLLGFHVMPPAFYANGYVNNGMMLLAPGAFFLLGVIVWVQRSISGYSES
ncbi:MAG TPA: NADH:ubiquinone reductase (Na(+)-transporting) subunit D [Candidatus Omnitrophica bacterium]|nr:MAG: NADH:ubiquinone reductase (Na(+)-transporting) subunit D [Omnitrophica WOR_2 bacterium GWA2_45_18]HBR14120.1 NADH:ubiquinone reductase (Na(+)-transporting) subunit D [Candidatus Omnitrophota bacterium]